MWVERIEIGGFGRLLNNLGGLNFQLGKPERAVEDLKSAYTVLLDKGSDAEAANVVSSLAHFPALLEEDLTGGWTP